MTDSILNLWNTFKFFSVAKRGQSFEDDNYVVEQVSSGETLSCLCVVELHVFGQDFGGEVYNMWVVDIIVAVEIFSGNSSMFFRVTTKHLCFFFLNLGSNFFRGKFCFPSKFFFVLRYGPNIGGKMLGSFLFYLGKANRVEWTRLEKWSIFFASVD